MLQIMHDGRCDIQTSMCWQQWQQEAKSVSKLVNAEDLSESLSAVMMFYFRKICISVTQFWSDLFQFDFSSNFFGSVSAA